MTERTVGKNVGLKFKEFLCSQISKEKLFKI